MGFSGALLLAQAQDGGTVTWAGDLASLMAAAAMMGYLSVGRHLRSWMDLFVYVFPVTLVSAILLSLWGMVRCDSP